MKGRWPIRLWFLVGVAPAALATLGKAVAPGLPTYADPGVTHAILALSCVAKIGCLLLSAVTSAQNARGFDADNPVRRAWSLLGVGFFGFFLGQACYAPAQIVLGVDPAFPSIADAFWVFGYAFLLAALVSFARTYASAGLDVGTAGQRRAIVGAAGVACALVGYLLLKPIVLASTPVLEKAINLSYSGFDLAIIVASAGLARTTLPLGGRVGRIWLWMMGGFFLACGGDVAFSYTSQLGVEALKPLVDVMLLLSYVAMARAALHQRRLALEDLG